LKWKRVGSGRHKMQPNVPGLIISICPCRDFGVNSWKAWIPTLKLLSCYQLGSSPPHHPLVLFGGDVLGA